MMNLTLNDLNNIINFIEWVLTQDICTEKIAFCENILHALKPFRMLAPTFKFLQNNQATIVIPFHIMTDVNSIVLEHQPAYNKVLEAAREVRRRELLEVWSLFDDKEE